MAPALIEASATGPKHSKSKSWILGINNNLSSPSFDRAPLKFDKVARSTACVFSLADANRRNAKAQFDSTEKLLGNNLVETNFGDITFGMEHAPSKEKPSDVDLKSEEEATALPVSSTRRSVEDDNVAPSLQTIVNCSVSVSSVVSCPADDKDRGRQEQPIALRDTVLLSVKDRKAHSAASYHALKQRSSKLDSQLRRMQLDFVTSHVEHGTLALADDAADPLLDCTATEQEAIALDAVAAATTTADDGRPQQQQQHHHPLHRRRFSGLSSPLSRGRVAFDSNNTADEGVAGRVKRSCKVLASHVSVLFHTSEQETTDVESGDELDDRDVLAAASSPRTGQLANSEAALRLSTIDTPVCHESSWLLDRAMAGSKCRWLEAQIADLDTKIRVYDNLSRQVSASRRGCKFRTFTPTLDDCGIKSVLDSDVEKIITDLPVILSKEGNCARKALNNNQVNGLVHSRSLQRDAVASRLDPVITTPESDDIPTCARACELIQRPRHQYINILKKAALCADSKLTDEAPTLSCNCPVTIQDCHLCEKGRRSWHRRLVGYKNQLDDGHHPRLSWDCDVLLPRHLERLMRGNVVNCDVKPKIHKQGIKRCLEKRKLPPVPLRPSKLGCLPNQRLHHAEKKKSLASHSLSSSYPGTMSSNHKNHKLKGSSPNMMKKKVVSVSAAQQLQKRAHRLSATFNDGGDTKCPTPGSADGAAVLSPLSAFPSAAIRKKRGSSAFDINNIVIPYSMAAATRVEKLNYKEILTPGWRMTEEQDSAPSKKVKVDTATLTPGCEAAEEPLEDISYTAFTIRHAACEVQERRRFSRFLPVRRLKSQKNSECNTPEPHSPGSDDSPRHSAAGTPTLDSSGTSLPPKPRLQRTPSLFFPAPLLEPEEEAVPPWPKQTFPISAVEFKQRCEDTTAVTTATRTRSQSETTDKDISIAPPDHMPTSEHNGSKVEQQRPVDSEPSAGDSPLSTSDSSPTNAAEEGWTVRLLGNEKVVDSDPAHCRKGIVLKLAKK